ncbi:MAG: hypothetical protein CMO64_05150 [Verrucomicrobiales bacterium]|nr:hypothetical protein [Verrucomicrobiales bacterium]|tara:strand:- start:347 stop:763 length:417 start_codon:yes stop_codon:yes gene_type:complete
MLQLLDILFYIIHLGIIAICVLGWIPSRYRRMHLAFCGLVGASWFGLGMWRGWGYCVLTDWHWEIKAQLGQEGLPWSFIKHVWDSTLPQPIEPATADQLAFVTFALAIVISIILNIMKPSGKVVSPPVSQTQTQIADP